MASIQTQNVTKAIRLSKGRARTGSVGTDGKIDLGVVSKIVTLKPVSINSSALKKE